MNILINCSNIRVGGGIQVAHSFINELKKEQSDFFVIILSSILSKQIIKTEFGENIIFIEYDIKAHPINTLKSSNIFLDNIVIKFEIEKVFTVFGPIYWRPKVKHISGYAKPHYIYKNSPFFKKISLKSKYVLKVKEFFHLLDFKKNADILITENPDVSIKLKKLINKEVFTVTNNYNQIFDDPEKWREIDLPNFNGKYLLTISANYPHKNLDIIPLIIQELIKRNIDRFKFVLTIKPGDIRSSKEIDQYIIYLGPVEVNKCPTLYNQVDYMFLPTLLECFSASYAEAMKMEKIILTSNLDFAKGICLNSAIYFDPLNAIEIVNELLKIDNDEAKKDLLRYNGLERLKSFDTASERANKYLEIIKNS